MTKVTIQVEEKHARELIQQKEKKADKINNVLNSFRSNEMTEMGGHYDRLKEDRDALLEEINKLKQELRNAQESEDYNDLTEVSGVGNLKSKALYEGGYKTVESLKRAEKDEISDVEGIGNALAARIKADVGDKEESTGSSLGELFG